MLLSRMPELREMWRVFREVLLAWGFAALLIVVIVAVLALAGQLAPPPNS